MASLMNPFSNGWDTDILFDLFNDRDVNLILQIPCCNIDREDKLMWLGESHGHFNVKSAYNLQQHVLQFPNDAISMWQNLWHLKILAKCKIFIWQACKNFLHTFYL